MCLSKNPSLFSAADLLVNGQFLPSIVSFPSFTLPGFIFFIELPGEHAFLSPPLSYS